MANRSFKELLGDWQTLFNSITPHLPDMPHLAKDHAALAPLLAEAQTLEDQQELQKSQLLQTNDRRLQIIQQGRTLRNQLAAGLKSSLGLDNKQLVEFGLKPRAKDLSRKPLTKAERADLLAQKAAKAQAKAAAALALKAATKASAEAAVIVVP
ncbi:MAG TPA: hypothetical protein VOA87_13970 [Thermoanaerobaculia bacterium]|nr:hypothetical protein [Thermoanaerobaculia bacterium]